MPFTHVAQVVEHLEGRFTQIIGYDAHLRPIPGVAVNLTAFDDQPGY